MFGAAKITEPKQPPAQPKVPSFRLDVMPVLFRAGCNTGGCHGAASGKDGFHLGLFGYDPAGDYWRITQQMVGRRLDLAVPEQSLLLLKATGAVPHSGGRRFKKDTEYYQTKLYKFAQRLQAAIGDDFDRLFPKPLTGAKRKARDDKKHQMALFDL